MTIAVAPFSLTGELRRRARETAEAIGRRLLVEMGADERRDPNHERYACRRLNGPVGFALAFLALATATADARFERAMHAQLKRATEAGGNRTGLFDGISGLRAVSALAAAIEPRYRALAAQCDVYIEAAFATAPVLPGWFGDYDVISGCSGMRLARCIEGALDEDRLTGLLAWLIEDDRRWTCPRTGSPEAPLPRRNLGMAHGLPGVLATLTLTLPLFSPRLREHIMRAAEFIVAHQRGNGDLPAWPRNLEDPPDEPCRSVWCYGAAGVASALLAVAQSMHELELETFARAVLHAVGRRSGTELGAEAQGICHGTSGLALIFFAAARRTGEPAFMRACERFTAETLGGLEAASGRCLTTGLDGVVYDAVGELNGVAGIALALLTMAGDFSDAWLRIHALSVSPDQGRRSGAQAVASPRSRSACLS